MLTQFFWILSGLFFWFPFVSFNLKVLNFDIIYYLNYFNIQLFYYSTKLEILLHILKICYIFDIKIKIYTFVLNNSFINLLLFCTTNVKMHVKFLIM